MSDIVCANLVAVVALLSSFLSAALMAFPLPERPSMSTVRFVIGRRRPGDVCCVCVCESWVGSFVKSLPQIGFRGSAARSIGRWGSSCQTASDFNMRRFLNCSPLLGLSSGLPPPRIFPGLACLEVYLALPRQHVAAISMCSTYRVARPWDSATR